MKEVELTGFGDLVQNLLDIPKAISDPEFWYRGQRDAEWPLRPAAFRKDRAHVSEREVLLRFKMNAPSIIPDCPDTKDYKRWLPIMQHHGVPTRLLDWSLSPLVALFFAVGNSDCETDAALFRFDPYRWNGAHYGRPAVVPIESVEDEEMLAIINNAFETKVKTIDNFLYPERKPKAPFPVFSSAGFQRSFMQQSVFTVHNKPKDMEDYDDTGLITKYIIPKDRIGEFRNVLQIFRINEFSIYYDPDSLGRWVKNLKS